MSNIMNLPLDVIIYKIIPYCATANDLTKLKNVSKLFNQNIITHSPIQKHCIRCNSTRFSISSKYKCPIENCMAIELFHPMYRYDDDNGNVYCSFGCAIKDLN